MANLPSWTISLSSFCAYAEGLCARGRVVDEADFDIDDVPMPRELVSFYRRVRGGPVHIGRPLYVIFFGHDVGITADIQQCRTSSSGISNPYYLKARDLLRAYSLWRYWLRLLVKKSIERVDIHHEALVRYARVSLPRKSEVDSEVPTEHLPDAPPMFAPSQSSVVIEFDDSDIEDAGARAETLAVGPHAIVESEDSVGLLDSEDLTDAVDAYKVEIVLFLNVDDSDS